MFDPKISLKNAPVKGLIFWQFPDSLNIDKFLDTAPLMLARYPGGDTLGIFGWGCAAGTLEPLAYTRASSAEFSYPLYTRINSPNPLSLYPRVAVFQKLLTEVTSTV